MTVPEMIDDIRRRMRALGLGMKGLSLASGRGETYVRDLLAGRSLNPKTEEIQTVLNTLDRLEAEAADAAFKKGRA
jgi:predicted transcriptional regulator